MSADALTGAPQLGRTRAQLVAFRAMCGRDLWVIARHDLAGFLAQSLLQPLFYLFIFGRVLPDIGAARGSYGSQLLPGVLGLTLFLTSLQNTALPLVIDFSFTKEIEDRLLAPLAAWALAVQKMVMAVPARDRRRAGDHPARRADPARRRRLRRRALARLRGPAARRPVRGLRRRAAARHRRRRRRRSTSCSRSC